MRRRNWEERSQEEIECASKEFDAVLIYRAEDYTPYGEDERWADPKKEYRDCSCGCRFYRPMEDEPLDFGVCVNLKSHRSGLLTFEHQGCHHFELESKE